MVNNMLYVICFYVTTVNIATATLESQITHTKSNRQ